MLARTTYHCRESLDQGGVARPRSKLTVRSHGTPTISRRPPCTYLTSHGRNNYAGAVTVENTNTIWFINFSTVVCRRPRTREADRLEKRTDIETNLNVSTTRTRGYAHARINARRKRLPEMANSIMIKRNDSTISIRTLLVYRQGWARYLKKSI